MIWDMLDEPTAIVDGYNSYYSFSRKRSGYSGTANFCRDSVTPVCAEEGLAGTLTVSETGSVGNYGNQTTFSDDELKDLDAEGRTVITQHRIRLEDGTEKDLAVINVYCPRFDPERHDRHHYKLRFYALLQTRAEALLKSGSHVIILGDINTTHKDIDHCDPDDEASNKRPSRLWLNQMFWEQDKDPSLDTDIDKEEFSAATPYTVGGKFVDTYRFFYPEKEGAFTNWCTLTNARATNFGRRLDYILADIDLANKCLKDASIMQDVEGSDHCPIKIELNCKCLPAKTCPPLCTKFMPEFSGKQQKLSTFFTKLTKKEVNSSLNICKNNKESENIVKKEEPKSSPEGVKSLKRPEKSNSFSQPLKRQKTTELKKTDSSSKQASLMSFFNKGAESKKRALKINQTMKVEQNKSSDKLETMETSSKYFSNEDKTRSNPEADDNEGKTAKTTSIVNENTSETANAWKNLLGGLGPAPLCKGHNEPCVLRMVKKPGPNKGKQFYTCARGEGLKSNPEARCDFFKWVVKKKT
ncbi:DNA-(apurinic or apyrimidinic site) endonuclease 2-like isoform X2 [Mercenaria mercenaria]|uniref:DNA-(apurinic or apyrimidinic site) endonuclease 2-like isoform X2 n=1 Tax=Mercenaria mercenaria TaxID=6596 RepID=UPI00234F66D0|nr:DNA-(apurinic or apyrimidinic site) endonuclease 2-like isoform X2 [Mercenaria mercenaria]